MRIPGRRFGLLVVLRCCHGVIPIRAVRTVRNKIDCSRRACFDNDVLEVAVAYLVAPEDLRVAYLEAWGFHLDNIRCENFDLFGNDFVGG